MRTRVLGTVALVSIGYFVAALVALHVLGDQDVVRQTTSAYVHGPYGALMTSAFPSVGFAVFALQLGLHHALEPSGRSRIGLLLLGVFSVGTLVAMSFPLDPEGAELSTRGLVHRINGPVSFISLSVGAVLISRRLGQDARFRSIRAPALALATSMVALFALVAVNLGAKLGYAGLSQRLLLGATVGWVVILAMRVRASREA